MQNWITRQAARRIGLLLAVPIFGACHRSIEPDYVHGKRADIDHTSLHPVLLRGEPVLSYDAIGSANYLAVSDSLLWIADGRGDPFIHLVDLRHAQVIRSTGRHGQGPGDFASTFGFSMRPADSAAAWSFDITGRRLTRVAADPHTPAQLIPAPIDAVQMAWVERDLLLLVTPSDSARLVLIDTAGTVVRESRGPLLGADSVPLKARLSASRSVKACVRPDGGAFALVYSDAGRAELYNSLLQRTTLLPVPFPSDGAFGKNADTGAWEARAPRKYYVSCAASQPYIYALFSGRHGDVERHVVVANSRYLHLFDWSGHLVAVFAFDHDVESLAVDGDSLLYGMSVGSDTLYRYRLPMRARAGQ